LKQIRQTAREQGHHVREGRNSGLLRMAGERPEIDSGDCEKVREEWLGFSAVRMVGAAVRPPKSGKGHPSLPPRMVLWHQPEWTSVLSPFFAKQAISRCAPQRMRTVCRFPASGI
jgi:hypothetical protein